VSLVKRIITLLLVIVLLLNVSCKEKIDVSANLEIVTEKMDYSINNRLSYMDDLIKFSLQNPSFTDDEFQNYVQDTFSLDAGIRSIQLAPGAVVTHVYPLEGNEAAIGHDLLADPNRREAVQRSIDNKEFVVIGPTALRQGGVALIARKPIFKQNGEFWGLGVILIDFDVIIKESSIDTNKEILYAIKGKEGLGDSGVTFYGDQNVFDSATNIVDVNFPSGSWQIAAIQR
jgi:sensor domain CHASE-containing protein